MSYPSKITQLLPHEYSINHQPWRNTFKDINQTPIEYYLNKKEINSSQELDFIIKEFLSDAVDLGAMIFTIEQSHYKDMVMKETRITFQPKENMDVINNLNIKSNIYKPPLDNMPVIIGDSLYPPSGNNPTDLNNLNARLLERFSKEHYLVLLSCLDISVEWYFHCSSNMYGLLDDNTNVLGVAYKNLFYKLEDKYNWIR